MKSEYYESRLANNIADYSMFRDVYIKNEEYSENISLELYSLRFRGGSNLVF